VEGFCEKSGRVRKQRYTAKSIFFIALSPEKAANSDVRLND
jgi:hypothetical protein